MKTPTKPELMMRLGDISAKVPHLPTHHLLRMVYDALLLAVSYMDDSNTGYAYLLGEQIAAMERRVNKAYARKMARITD